MKVWQHFLLYWMGMAHAQTQTTENERQVLAKFAKGRRYLVEVGVWHGVTTSLLRREMAREGILYAIDPFPIGRMGFSVQRAIAHQEVSKVKNGKVVWVRSLGSAALAESRALGLESVDFIFIDGDHSFEGLAEDWKNWAPLISPGGFVALHDSRSSQLRDISDAGSVRFTKDKILIDPRFVLEQEEESLTVLRRLA